MGGNEQANANTGASKDEENSSWSVSGSYSDLDRKQETNATVGLGVLRVRNDEETGTDSTAGLNRDIDTAQVVTKDKETGFDLYVTSTAIDAIEGLFQKDENGNNKTLSRWADNVTSIFDPETYSQMMGNVAEMTDPAKIAAAWEQAKTTVGLVKVTLPDTSGLDAALQEKINLAQQQGQAVEFLSSDGEIQVVQIGDTTFAVGEKIINQMEASLTAYVSTEEKWTNMALRDAESQQAMQDSDFDAQQRNSDRFYQALGESNANNRDGYNTGLNWDNTTGTLTDYSDWRSPQAQAFDAIYGAPAGTTLGQLGQVGGSIIGGFAHLAYDSTTDLMGLALTGAHLYSNPAGGISGLLSGNTLGGQFATGAQSWADNYVSSFGPGSVTGGFGNEAMKDGFEIGLLATGFWGAGGANTTAKITSEIGAGRKNGQSIFNPEGGRDNCVNSVCAFLNTFNTGELHTASLDVAKNNGSIHTVLNQIENMTGATIGRKGQFSTLETARDRQLFVVFQEPHFQTSNHVGVGIVNNGNKVIFDPQTGQTFKKLDEWNSSGSGSFTSFPLIFKKE